MARVASAARHVPLLRLYCLSASLDFVLATNNSSRTQQDYVDKLASMGVSGIEPSAHRHQRHSHRQLLENAIPGRRAHTRPRRRLA